MQVVNKVLSKWNKKTELANHKISLNLQADISKVLDEMEDALDELGRAPSDLGKLSFEVKNAFDEFNAVADEYLLLSRNANSYIQNARKVAKKVEEIAKDLGVDPSSVKNYNLINQYEKELDKAQEDIDDIIEKFGNFNF